MAFTEWTMEGAEFVSCSCQPGCPCQFSSPPSHGHCHALTFIQVSRGHFGGVPLDGLSWGFFGAWPAAVHKGNGVFQAVVDARGDATQRAALEAVCLGRETDPGRLVTQVFSTTVTQVLPTVVAPIHLQIDVDARMATLGIPGVLDAHISPIRNPVTGIPQRARVTLPAGFEYTDAEFALGFAKAPGAIPLDFDATHAHLAAIHWSTHGVIR